MSGLLFPPLWRGLPHSILPGARPRDDVVLLLHTLSSVLIHSSPLPVRAPLHVCLTHISEYYVHNHQPSRFAVPSSIPTVHQNGIILLCLLLYEYLEDACGNARFPSAPWGQRCTGRRAHVVRLVCIWVRLEGYWLNSAEWKTSYCPVQKRIHPPQKNKVRVGHTPRGSCGGS